MTPYETYVLYSALKNHFTTESYDFIKYHGKIKTSIDQFQTRKDRFFFAKLAKRKDVKDFLISNFVIGESNLWVGDLVGNCKYEQIYVDWKKRFQALSYYFEQELKNCLTSLDENVIVKNQQHPFLLKIFLRKKISIESLIILDDLLGFSKHWNKELGDDIVWKEVNLLCKKYRPFLNYDKQKMRNIALTVFDK